MFCGACSIISVMNQRERKVSAYKHLFENLREAIEQGFYADGKRMPTEAELRKDYGVSRHTVRQAFQDLVAEGLVYRVPGRGTFVTGLSTRGRYLRSFGTVEELMSWTGTEMEVLSPCEVRTEPEAAARLGVSGEEVALLIVRRRYEGVPFVVTHVSIPPELCEALTADNFPTDESRTVLGTLERFLPHPVAGASQEITALPAPAELSSLIDCQPGEPILYVEREYFDSTGKPVELAISHYNPRRYSYRLELRRRLP
jgi:GntR family transcriptional regulator